MGELISAPDITAAPVQGIGQKDSYKCRLHEHIQKASITFPIYETVNIGNIHKPMFRSTVKFDGKSFASPNAFTQRKAAEQDAARVALEKICSNLQHESEALIRKFEILCKSILYEYAVVMALKFPTYSTSSLESKFPSFVTTVEFDGKTYTGCPGRNKKVAERLGARAVIESIIGTSSETRLSMFRIIKSKSNKLLPAVMSKTSDVPLIHGEVVIVGEHGQPADPTPLITVKEEIPCVLPSSPAENGRTSVIIPQCDAVVGSSTNKEEGIPEIEQHLVPDETIGAPKAKKQKQ